MPVALVIGHTGQDGRILQEQLVDSGVRVVGVARGRLLSDGVESMHAIDLADRDAVARLLDQAAPDQVYYLAARHHSSQESEADPVDEWRGSWSTHVDQFVCILEGLRGAGARPPVFFASSSRVFGHALPGRKDESSPLRPACVYGVTKAAAMLAAGRYRDEYAMPVSCGILFNHESPLRASGYLSQKIAEGLVAVKLGERDCVEIGDLEARVDWGYAPDYVRAMRMIVGSAPPGDYVIASGVAHGVADMVRVAARRLDLDPVKSVRVSNGVLRRRSQPLWGDAARLEAETGWKPMVSFEQMVNIMVEDAARRRGLILDPPVEPASGSA